MQGVNPAPASLSQLPLFPLQTVLFPGGLLPLRIFEVRYLDMIGRCHKTGTPFGVVCLTRGSEVRRPQPPSAGAPKPSGDGFADEAFCEVGTLATINLLERPQPGLMMIHCTGTQRFRIRTSVQLKHGLWTADAELLAGDAEVAVPEDLAFTRRGLRHVAESIARHSPDTTELPHPQRWDDCGWLANRWSELLPVSIETRQRFMALDNPLLRLELVADALHQIGFKLPAEPGA